MTKSKVHYYRFCNEETKEYKEDLTLSFKSQNEEEFISENVKITTDQNLLVKFKSSENKEHIITMKS